MDDGSTLTNPSHAASHECALCAAHAKVAATRHAPRRRRSEWYIPWLIAIGLSGPFALFVQGPERWLSLGLCLGLVGGALLVWRTRLASDHHAAHMVAANVTELNANADQRVAMVIRQFEWAVNDVANLRDALKRAQDARAAAEASALRIRKHAHRLEAQLYEARVKIGEYSRALGSEPVVAEEEAEPETDHLVVPVVWRVFEENELQWLRLESAGIALSQVRLSNSARTVIAISAKAIDPADATRSSLVLRVPDEVRVALEHQADDLRKFTFEALVDDVWCPVEMRDARDRGTSKTEDKRGRVWRPEDQGEKTLIA